MDDFFLLWDNDAAFAFQIDNASPSVNQSSAKRTSQLIGK